MSNKRVPKRRFKQFKDDGEWESQKFTELAQVRRGLTYSPKNLTDNKGTLVLRSSNIQNDVITYNEDDVFVNKEAIQIPYVNKQDILVTAANGSPHLVGKHAVIENIKQPMVHGGFMLLLSAENPYFLNASMHTKWYKKFIELYALGGGGAIGNISQQNLENQRVPVPSKKEQKVLGYFFTKLDKTIELDRKSVV